MKIKIMRQELLDIVNKVKTVVSARSALPILSHILMEAKDSSLRLTATDLKVSIECTVDCTVEEPGSLTVSSQRLGMILTDAELEPDPLIPEDQRVCDRCMSCVPDCPGHCIPHIRENDTVSIEIEGVKFEWANVDMGKCTLTHHGLNKEASPFLARD